ncbi:ATP-binding cassette sub-family G member 3, partial [Lemmus lemmus]
CLRKKSVIVCLIITFIHFHPKADEHTVLSERQYQVREKLANMYAQSSLYSEMRTELDPLLGEQNAGRSSALEEITCVTPFWHQFWWIFFCSFKNFPGFQLANGIQAILTVIAAVLLGIAFRVLINDCTEVQTRASLLFFIMVVQCVIGLTAGLLFTTDSDDRDRFLHEYTSGYYRVSSYFPGKLLGELVPMMLLPSITFTIILYS